MKRAEVGGRQCTWRPSTCGRSPRSLSRRARRRSPLIPSWAPAAQREEEEPPQSDDTHNTPFLPNLAFRGRSNGTEAKGGCMGAAYLGIGAIYCLISWDESAGGAEKLLPGLQAMVSAIMCAGEYRTLKQPRMLRSNREGLGRNEPTLFLGWSTRDVGSTSLSLPLVVRDVDETIVSGSCHPTLRFGLLQ